MAILARAKEKRAELAGAVEPSQPPEDQVPGAFVAGGGLGGFHGGKVVGGLGGGTTGALLGLMIANRAKPTDKYRRLKQLLGVGLGGLGGYAAGQVGGGVAGALTGTLASLGALANTPELAQRPLLKKAQEPATAFADAVQQMQAAQLRADALRDMRNVGLTALGVGAAGRGLVGLLGLLRRGGPKKSRSGPTLLPLPYPVEPEEAPRKVLKAAGVRDFLSGSNAATVAGIPWYYPAAMLTGLASLGAGWKGLDMALNARRKTETERELAKSRAEFHDALLSQYQAPLKTPGKEKKAAALSTMTKVGEALDQLYELFQNKLAAADKAGLDLANTGGAVLGGYGVYAGLASLLTGALVYDKMRRRSRQAVLEKALQRRQRRRFAQAPTEIYAVPEPVVRLPKPSQQAELQALTAAEE